MALMAAHGEIGPMPDCAIFADTGWEPKAVQRHLEWLRSPNVLPFPVHVVSAGNIRDDAIAGSSARSGRFAAVPWFLKMPDGSAGMGRRQCTAHYKLEPIRKKIRDLLGVSPRGRVPKGAAEVWVGISLDEVVRMKPSRVGYIVNRWPLIEKRMNRNDCLRWIERREYPEPPKSSCIGCPFHTDAQWRALSPEEMADAAEVDRAIRVSKRGIRGEQFMHRSLKPINEVDLSTLEDHGQINLFNNECEGMCGV